MKKKSRLRVAVECFWPVVAGWAIVFALPFMAPVLRTFALVVQGLLLSWIFWQARRAYWNAQFYRELRHLNAESYRRTAVAQFERQEIELERLRTELDLPGEFRFELPTREERIAQIDRFYEGLLPKGKAR